MSNIPNIKPTKVRICRWLILMGISPTVFAFFLTNSDFFGIKHAEQPIPPYIELFLIFLFILALWFFCERLFLEFVMKTR